MINKTRLGVPLFDDLIGGVYRKRPVLCCGRRGSGKTIFALHCLKQAVNDGEKAILLSSWNPRDLSIIGEKALNFSCEEAAARGTVTILEYEGIMTTPVFEENVTLPPDSFFEFIRIIEEKAATRVIIDTVLPWVAIRQKERVAKHVFSFIQALDRLGVTAVLTMPRPVSALAFSLKNMMEDQTPVALTLDVDQAGKRTLTINKYLGESALPPPVNFEIVSGQGIVPAGTHLSGNKPESSHNAPTQPPGGGRPIRFASAFKNI